MGGEGDTGVEEGAWGRRSRAEGQGGALLHCATTAWGMWGDYKNNIVDRKRRAAQGRAGRGVERERNPAALHHIRGGWGTREARGTLPP